MKNRSPLSVFVLGLATFGLYSLIWSVRTKNEMVGLGANIPTALLLLVPFANIWWIWKWSKGVEHVTGGKITGVIALLVEWFLGPIGDAIIQDSFNKVPAVVAPVPPVVPPVDNNVYPTTPTPVV